MGGILLTHLQNLPCNAHTLDELEVPPGSVKDSVQVKIYICQIIVIINIIKVIITTILFKLHNLNHHICRMRLAPPLLEVCR